MRIVEKLLYGIGGLLALILFFILVCHFHPDIAENLGNSLAKNQENAAVSTDSGLSVQTPDTIMVSTATAATDGVEASPSGYEAPEESSISVPSAVSGLNGMEAVKASGVEITDSMAQELESTLGVGNTGDTLTFDTLMYPYYQMLDDTGKALYRQIYANAQDLTESFAPVQEDITASQLRYAFMAVCDDHPELFWINTAYRYQYAPSGKIAEIDLSFNVTAAQRDTAQAAIDAALKDITDKTYGVYDDYGKEVIVHDALLDMTLYDKNAPMNQSMYSALVNGRTVCAGYARAFQYVMQQLGVPCYFVEGYAGESHAWNIICLDGEYYNVDATWGDTTPHTYDYFNCSDAAFAKDHARRELSVYLPGCNGSRYSELEENPPAGDSDTKDIVYVGYVTPDKTTTAAATTPQTTETTTTTTTTPDAASTGTTTMQGTTQTRITATAYGNTGNGTDVLTSLEDYYLDCLQKLLDSTQNTVTFRSVIENETLWNKLVKAYENGDYEEGYANRALVEKHLGFCTINVTGTPQSDGTYVVEHTVVMR